MNIVDIALTTSNSYLSYKYVSWDSNKQYDSKCFNLTHVCQLKFVKNKGVDDYNNK